MDPATSKRARVIFSTNQVLYNGKLHDHIGKLNATIEGLLALQDESSHDRKEDGPQSKRARFEVAGSKLEHIIIAPYSGTHPDRDARPNGVDGANDTHGLQRHTWSDFLQMGARDEPFTFEQLDFNQPLWILFSSGTTGTPKAITHRAGGMLLQLGKEHLLHLSLIHISEPTRHTNASRMPSSA